MMIWKIIGERRNSFCGSDARQIVLSRCVKQSTIILGIDPGTLIMGYAIIEVSGQSIHLLKMDAIKLASEKNPYQRLEIIHKKICELISFHKPNMFAIEAPFFGKNVQSMLKLGRAQGVAIAAAMQASIPVTEYSPKRIKQSITGNGNASKEQVFKMLQRIILIEEKPNFFDASDALAVAICHHYSNASPIKIEGKLTRDWKEFLVQNPQRFIK